MQQSRSVERDALAEAATSRACRLSVESVNATAAVKGAVKAFNREIVSIPDYLHYHPQYILDSLMLIQKICSDLITHSGKSPKNLTQPLRVKVKAFMKKTHGVQHAYPALLMLGFKEVVVDMEKHLEYCGRFHQDPGQNHEFLRQAKPLIYKSIQGVEKHIQMSSGDVGERRLKQEAERAAALARIDADREAQHARAAREQAARHALGVAKVKSPWKPNRRRSTGGSGDGDASAGGSPSGGGGGDFPDDEAGEY